MQQSSPTGHSWLMVAALGLIWGSTFMVIEVALKGITPFWLAAGRITFAALLTTAIWQVKGRRLFAPGPAFPWATLGIVGALSSAVPFMAISWGQQFVTSGFAGVSMAAVALMVLPLAHFMVPGDALTKRKSLGFLIGFIGVVILIGPGAFSSTGTAGEGAGRLALLGAASCYALSSVLMRRLPPVDPIGLSAVTLIIGAVIVIVVALMVEGTPPLPDNRTLILIAILGLIPTAGANLLRVLVIRTAGPTFMSLTNYQVPIWSVLMGTIFLGEPLNPNLFLALAMILSGVALSQWGALRRLFRRP